MTETPATARVATKPAWMSKINWTQVAAAVMTLITTNALGLDDATQVKVLAFTTVAQSMLTVVLKTFYTNTITPSSLPAQPPRA